MFFQLFYYRLLRILRCREELFWTLLFPLILGTLFYASFGNLMKNGVESEPIPIAVIHNTSSEEFDMVLSSVADGSKDALLQIKEVSSKEEAQKLLDDEDISGILYVDTTPSLDVKEENLDTSILKAFLDQYIQSMSVIQNTEKAQPDRMLQVAAALMESSDFVKQGHLGTKDLSGLAQFFYALIAMACLYGCFSGASCASDMSAATDLGARRSVAPIHKLTVILADFLATVVILFCSLLILLFYLYVILDLSLGTNLPLILLTCLAGCIIGVANGVVIGSINRLKENTRIGILIGITMIFCFLSGLMLSGMKNIVEHNIPILNRINPAALITDCFYSLNAYDTYERYITNIAILFGMAFLLCILSYFMLRKERRQ